jgi:hypothetical protein
MATKLLKYTIVEDKANKRFIAKIVTEGYPIIVTGNSSEEAKHKLDMAIRASCFLLNFNAVKNMLDRNVYDLSIVNTEIAKNNYSLVAA